MKKVRAVRGVVRSGQSGSARAGTQMISQRTWSEIWPCVFQKKCLRNWKRTAALCAVALMLWVNPAVAASAAEVEQTAGMEQETESAVSEGAVDETNVIIDNNSNGSSDDSNMPDSDAGTANTEGSEESTGPVNSVGGSGGGVKVSGTDNGIITLEADGNGIHVAKSLRNLNETTLEVTLESYTRGETVREICPADIVLCMDISGSMVRPLPGNTYNINKLRSAAYKFIDKLAEQNSNLNQDEQSRLALVQYGNADETVMLSGLDYVTGDNVTEMKKEVENLNPELGHMTSMDKAMLIAKDILDKDTAVNRDKVVVLFTDGIPSSDKPTKVEGFVRAIANSVLDTAKSLKKQGVKIYGLNIEQHASNAYDVLPDYQPKGLANNVAKFYGLDESQYPINTDDAEAVKLENRFMFLLSSAFPKASDIDTPNEDNLELSEEQKSYYFAGTDTDKLIAAFETVAKSIVKTTSDFGTDAQARDFITSDYELADTAAVKVYTADYQGNGNWAAPFDITNLETTVITATENAVTVSGFNYKENYIVEASESQDGAVHGKKLIIQFPIVSRRTFGGNHVPTNEENSGIYENAKSQAPSVTYPVPSADLQINYRIQAEDRLVYVPDGADISQVFPYVEGYKPDGTLNEYVNIHYTLKDQNGDTLAQMDIPAGENADSHGWIFADPENQTALECGYYTVSCSVTPLETGHYETAVLEDTSNIHVLHPKVLFQDSEQNYGDVADTKVGTYEDLTAMGSHRVSLTWVCPETCSGRIEVPEEKGVTPDMEYEIDLPKGTVEGNEEGQRIIHTMEDIPVVVNLHRVSDYPTPVDVTAQTEFLQKCSRSDCGYEAVKTSGDPAGARYLIHVNSNPVQVLPSTGGKGTGRFLSSAIAMASMLMVWKAWQKAHLTHI